MVAEGVRGLLAHGRVLWCARQAPIATEISRSSLSCKACKAV